MTPQKVAAEICKMCHGSTTEAQQYLNMQGCMRDDGRPWSGESVLDIVASIAVVVEPCTHSVSTNADDEARSIEGAALSSLLNHNTCAWVRDQNVKKGIAPMVQTTLTKYETFKTRFG